MLLYMLLTAAWPLCLCSGKLQLEYPVSAHDLNASPDTCLTCVLGELHGQGEGLAQAMTQVPMQYFTEEFDLTRFSCHDTACAN